MTTKPGQGNNGNKGFDLSTPGGATSRDVIRLIYGGALAKELVDMDQTCADLDFSIKGHLSNANYNTKKLTFILFINGG